MEQEHQFIDYIEQSIIKNWDKDSLMPVIPSWHIHLSLT